MASPPDGSLNVPAFPAAETRFFVGPFLRFAGGTEPGSSSWRASVLCLTRPSGGTPTAAQPAANGGTRTGAVAVGAESSELHACLPAPTLALQDEAGQGSARMRQVSAQLLDRVLGWTAWRFDFELPLLQWQRPVRYAVSAGAADTPTYTFWLPALGQPMHWAYYSCNGISADVAATAPERQDATYLWRDMLQLHSAFPLHCMVGGGDQVYNDGVWKCPLLAAWGASADYDKKIAAEWTQEMEAQATRFYFNNYSDAFSAPDVDVALAQIAQVNMWDDHDIWDGYGSYDHEIQNSAVFQGLFRVARRFYLLFQHHTTDAFNAAAREFLVNDGTSFHFVRWMGPQVVVLGMDMRSQRAKHRIMPQEAYALFKREVAGLPLAPLHLVVLSGVPVIFPKIPAAESVLGCMGRVTRRLPAVKKMARNTGLLDRFDQPEILDDLIDGWVANEHADERLQFIRMLQDWSLSRKLRVSILSGDAHVGGVGRFYTHPKIKPIEDDPLFMVQIISSAIVNAPPPHPVVKMLMRTNFASNVDGRTREKLVRAFYPHHPRTDKLIAQRNWCDVCLVTPPFSPPTVPRDENFGGLLFQLRVEDAKHRRSYAEEVYRIVAPRHPGAATSAVTTAGLAHMTGVMPLPGQPSQVSAVAAAVEGGSSGLGEQAQRAQHAQQLGAQGLMAQPTAETATAAPSGKVAGGAVPAGQAPIRLAQGTPLV